MPFRCYHADVIHIIDTTILADRLTGTGERTKTGGPKTNRGKKTTTGTQSPALSRGWATDRSRTGRHKNRRAML